MIFHIYKKVAINNFTTQKILFYENQITSLEKKIEDLKKEFKLVSNSKTFIKRNMFLQNHGKAIFVDFIKNNLVYPSDGGVQGRVIVGFVVEKDGSITNVDIVRSVHPALDEAAINFVNKMPKWIPATNKGKIVRSRYYLPVVFKPKEE